MTRAVGAPPPAPAAERVGYRQLLAVAPYRVLLCGYGLGTVAESLRAVALSVLVLTATGSTVLGALAYGISFIPQVIGSGLFGNVADRVQPARLIGLGYLLEGATAVVLVLVALPYWAVLALVAAVAATTPVSQGATGRAVAEVLPGAAYVPGRSLLNVVSSGAQLLGLGCGGLAVAALGARRALLVTALAHLAAGLWAARLGPLPLPVPRPTGGRRSGVGGRRSGVGGRRSTVGGSWAENGRLLADRRVRLLLLVRWLPPAFATGAESLVLPYVRDRGLSTGTGGVLLACLPIGMLVGNTVLGRFVRTGTVERSVLPLLAVLGAPLLAFAVPGLPVALGGVLLIAVGVGFCYSLGLQRPFLAAVPERSRGQAFGLQSTGLMTAQGLSPVAAGLIAEAMTTGRSVAVMGVLVLATAGLFARRLPALVTALPEGADP
ncbi:MFS transporter [Kitasatospora sp. NPDC028055]|uniref:MFS transporter n=1 Tax=Kitasatospora sp. NPDC028055 TaxID=3155653 RepID=UPI0033CE06AB